MATLEVPYYGRYYLHNSAFLVGVRWRAGIGFSHAGAGSVRNEFLKIVRDAGRAGAGPAHVLRVF